MLAGLSVCLVGIRLRTQCYRQLGKRFTYDLRSHSRGGPGLVTTGPYSVVRHPSYVAAMMTWAGFAIAYLDPRITKSIKFDGLSHQMNIGLYNLWHAALAVPCALFPVLLVMRIRGEERILAQEFGPRWAQYARRVKWKLIPYIW
ncbi:hypothetical protein BKA62DRAFT_721369 [Auriculariales sp. MPI-PUGE-AT-0066]|nr:hypothetical protein BKA62DRAFT_721369 [Auriculariales sp. MPI-PUGE-AT-0066]